MSIYLFFFFWKADPFSKSKESEPKLLISLVRRNSWWRDVQEKCSSFQSTGNYLINCRLDVLNYVPVDRGDVSQTLICTVGAVFSLASSGLMYQTRKCQRIHVNIIDKKKWMLQKLPPFFFLFQMWGSWFTGYSLKKPVSYWVVGMSSDI